jgi:hypothetical protein
MKVSLLNKLLWLHLRKLIFSVTKLKLSNWWNSALLFLFQDRIYVGFSYLCFYHLNFIIEPIYLVLFMFKYFMF